MIRKRFGLRFCTVAVVAAGGVLVWLTLVVALLLRSDVPVGELVEVCVLGVLVVVMTGLAVAALAERVAAALRRMRVAVARELVDPGSGETALRAGRPVLTGSLVPSEVADLAETVSALQLRARLADDIARRYRHSAETASAGMFELLSGLVEAEEGARGQLAAELHDTAAQSLAAARRLLADAAVHIDTAPDTAGIDPAARADVNRAAAYVDEAEQQVRALMARTRPPALREDDLAAAVGLLRDDMALRYGLTVHVDWPQDAHAVPLATALTLYRFYQEGLLNIVKHADVDEAELRLRVENDEIVASVSDTGPGFDAAALAPAAAGGRHVGLGLMRERARLAGGSVRIDSAPGRGTTLILRLRRPTVPRARQPR
ncbi:MAG: sensor histidine kinase [Frankiaceae bacterium]